MNLSQIIVKPLITEKSMQETAFNRYCFQVQKKATKKEIKKAIETLFKVQVTAVKTQIIKGKTRKTGRTRKTVTLGDWKKAYAELAPGQKIEIFEETSK
jgi:large subunit ribosomal protein L23